MLERSDQGEYAALDCAAWQLQATKASAYRITTVDLFEPVKGLKNKRRLVKASQQLTWNELLNLAEREHGHRQDAEAQVGGAESDEQNVDGTLSKCRPREDH